MKFGRDAPSRWGVWAGREESISSPDIQRGQAPVEERERELHPMAEEGDEANIKIVELSSKAERVAVPADMNGSTHHTLERQSGLVEGNLARADLGRALGPAATLRALTSRARAKALLNLTFGGRVLSLPPSLSPPPSSFWRCLHLALFADGMVVVMKLYWESLCGCFCTSA